MDPEDKDLHTLNLPKLGKLDPEDISDGVEGVLLSLIVNVNILDANLHFGVIDVNGLKILFGDYIYIFFL